MLSRQVNRPICTTASYYATTVIDLAGFTFLRGSLHDHSGSPSGRCILASGEASMKGGP